MYQVIVATNVLPIIRSISVPFTSYLLSLPLLFYPYKDQDHKVALRCLYGLHLKSSNFAAIIF